MSEQEIARELDGTRLFYQLKDDWEEIFKPQYYSKILSVVNKYEDLLGCVSLELYDFYRLYYRDGLSLGNISEELGIRIPILKKYKKELLSFFAKNLT